MKNWFEEKINAGVLITVVILVGIGLLSIYSATYDTGASDYFNRQLVWAGFGFLFMIIITFIPFRTLQLLSYPIYILSIILLFLVLLIGKSVAGSKSWFGFGNVGIQPSEFAKVAVILALAYFLSDKKVNLRRMKYILLSFTFVLLPVVLIIRQPDTGTALIFIASLISILYWAGVSNTLMLGIIAPTLAAVSALFGITYFLIVVLLLLIVLFLQRENKLISAIIFSITVLIGISVQYVYGKLAPYQQKRIDIFINPESDPLNAGYNVIQSKIAIGSGGIIGKGFLQGTQTQLNFIPAQWTDFVFCVPAEEFGFIGAFFILLMYFYLLYRAIHIASTAKSKYGSLVAFGVVSFFLVHIVINIGMVMGIMPVIGVPLPFLSYGGSFLFSSLIMAGLLLNIYANRKEY
ncbi:MAG: Rod shape-determining protein RodA [Ignavibacteriae bacterium]|nr:MAG: Rod shape-determining protein RodA [Ignavibacteriota bacterium]